MLNKNWTIQYSSSGENHALPLTSCLWLIALPPRKIATINFLHWKTHVLKWKHYNTLRWRHNGCDSVSNHQPRECLLRRLIRRTSKKTSKLRVTGLCAGNSPETGEFPAQMASNAENVSIWWRHHDGEQFHWTMFGVPGHRWISIGTHWSYYPLASWLSPSDILFIFLSLSQLPVSIFFGLWVSFFVKTSALHYHISKM